MIQYKLKTFDPFRKEWMTLRVLVASLLFSLVFSRDSRKASNRSEHQRIAWKYALLLPTRAQHPPPCSSSHDEAASKNTINFLHCLSCVMADVDRQSQCIIKHHLIFAHYSYQIIFLLSRDLSYSSCYVIQSNNLFKKYGRWRYCTFG